MERPVMDSQVLDIDMMTDESVGNSDVPPPTSSPTSNPCSAAPPTPGPAPGTPTASEAGTEASLAESVANLSNATWDLVSHVGSVQQRLDRVAAAAAEEIRGSFAHLCRSSVPLISDTEWSDFLYNAMLQILSVPLPCKGNLAIPFQVLVGPSSISRRCSRIRLSGILTMNG